MQKVIGRMLATTVCALLLPQCSSESEQESAPPAAPPTPVEVESARTGTLVDSLTLNAEVLPLHHTTLASGTGGKVDSVSVDAGSRVESGQVVVRIAAALARAQLKQAEVAFESASAAHGRVQALDKKGLASRSTVDKARSALAQGEAALALARVRHDDALIRAPHAGEISERFIGRGEFAQPGRPLLELVDTSTVKLIAQIPERDAPQFAKGRAATVLIDALPAQSFEGEVVRIGAVASRHSRTFDLEVRIANPAGVLRPGMLARITLVRATFENVITVRRDAVFEDVDGSNVFVIVQDRAEQRPVVMGATHEGRVAVLKGLTSAERVVVVGQRSLVQGQPVTVTVDHGLSHAPPVAKGPRDQAAPTEAAQ